MPEDFPAAVCVPVSTSTTILGTLWIFSAQAARFHRAADELAGDRRRSAGRRPGAGNPPSRSRRGRGSEKQLAAAERLQSNQLPTISPLLDGWQLAGWTAQADGLGGDFHDWFCLPDGLLAVAAGHAMDRGVEAALAAAAMKAALRAHGQYCREAQQTLKRLNLTTVDRLGRRPARHAVFRPDSDRDRAGFSCASAGQPSVLRIRPDGWESLSQVVAAVGRESGIGLRAIRLGNCSPARSW